MASLQQDVFRLDVAVNHPPLKRILQRIGYFACNAQRVVDRQLFFTIQPVAQRFAFDKRHHIEHRAVHSAGVMQRENMRMLQGVGRLDLGQETLGADGHR